jgi:hypothetical protein
MVHSSTLVVTTDSERLTCSGFSLSKIVRFGSLEFIADCFGILSLSLKGSNLGTVFMGMARSGSPSLHTILEDFADEFYMTSSRERSFGFPISQRHSMGALPAPIITTPWSEDAPTPHTMAMNPPRTIVPQSDTEAPS